MSEEIEKNEEIAIIEKAPQVFEKAPAILLANQTRSIFNGLIAFWI